MLIRLKYLLFKLFTHQISSRYVTFLNKITRGKKCSKENPFSESFVYAFMGSAEYSWEKISIAVQICIRYLIHIYALYSFALFVYNSFGPHSYRWSPQYQIKWMIMEFAVLGLQHNASVQVRNLFESPEATIVRAREITNWHERKIKVQEKSINTR